MYSWCAWANRAARLALPALLSAWLTACAVTPPAAVAPATETGTPPVVEPEPAVPLEQGPAIAPEPPPPPPPKPPLRIAAVGDLMLGTDYPSNRLAADDGAGQLEQARPFLESADVAFGNLEGALVDGGEPAKFCKDPSLCYLFRSPTRYATHLRDAGFDVISLANNHARDFGEEGRDSSMQALDGAGIAHSGRSGTVASWRQGEYRLAMAAFAPNIGSNSIHDIEAAACLVSDLASRHDLVLVSFHGGSEGADAMRLTFAEEFYYGESRGDVVAFSRRMVDAGADMVIGHGPHVPRAMELYRGRLIAYSLGNFATYYGISVSGDKGVAPLLLATLDETGQLLEGQVVSFRQQRPAGPRLDDSGRAVRLIRDLTRSDLDGGGLAFDEQGRFTPQLTRRPHPGENQFPAPSACGTGASAPSQPASPADPPFHR